MEFLRNKKIIFLLLLLVAMNGYGQDSLASKKWFIVLPLRFTHLQNNNTMLSGVKIGRKLNDRLLTSVSVYHSFYLKSFKAKAAISGFDNQPLLFINCVGGEIEYYLFKGEKINTSLQLLLGWGFIKYDLKEYNFSCKQINYFALEPAFNTEYNVSKTTAIGIGIGYRPLFSGGWLSYSSAISDGKLPVHKDFHNGLNIILTIKGFL